ncbi:nucleoside/nucleotide kinase family protein [Celeribacter sp.]|uniref:nucleoside/nucleotide kinase family protein n=1 Tax=Celeribacter sp. TaxID=1890673 RepID=UPI003A8D4CC9
MMSANEIAEALAKDILAAPRSGKRKLIALAGPPASGKTTLSWGLADLLSQAGHRTAVVPMDGFHLDNRILADLDLLHRKGAPETFDAAGVLRLAQALPNADRVFYPTFDRDEDFSRAGAGMVDDACDCVVIEGNYLLYDAPIWKDLHPLWDVSIRLDVPHDILRERLFQRWIDFGLSPQDAERRAVNNDMVNVEAIANRALPATITICAEASTNAP